MFTRITLSLSLLSRNFCLLSYSHIWILLVVQIGYKYINEMTQLNHLHINTLLVDFEVLFLLSSKSAYKPLHQKVLRICCLVSDLQN